jgi:hypothetical protein
VGIRLVKQFELQRLCWRRLNGERAIDPVHDAARTALEEVANLGLGRFRVLDRSNVEACRLTG